MAAAVIIALSFRVIRTSVVSFKKSSQRWCKQQRENNIYWNCVDRLRRYNRGKLEEKLAINRFITSRLPVISHQGNVKYFGSNQDSDLSQLISQRISWS